MNLPVAQQPRPPEKPPASSRFQFATGDRPLSGYTIKRGLGRGGFGEVYFAVSDGGKEVALKLIRRNLDVELRGVQHCLNLKHPNLIALYDVRRDGDDDDCWIVMEYVADESLEGAIRRHPQGMPADEAVDWLRGIAAGASYLHSHGIVHRDLKPGNIFRDESLVKLGDYGLSKFISCSRRSGQTESVGTVHYMAPEIAHGRYGREIDIYALGVILYEMLTGRVPFDGESVGEVLMKHLTAQPDVSVVPAAYRPVVARALAKDPAVRFGTIEELLAALPGAGSAAAAANPHFATAAAATSPAAARPTFPQGGNSAPPRDQSAARQAARDFYAGVSHDHAKVRAESPARPAAYDPVPPARVLWALGIVLMLLVVVPASFAFGFTSGRPSAGDRLIYALLCGLAVSFLARSRARWRAGQLSANGNWPATSDIPPPLPPLPARQSTAAAAAAARSARPSLFDRLAAMHPVALAAIVVVFMIVVPRQLMAHNLINPNLFPRVWFGLSVLVALFLVKWGLRAVSGPRTGPILPAPPPAASAAAPPRTAFQNLAFEIGKTAPLAGERAIPALVFKSPRERLIELLESLLLSAGVAMVLAVIAAAWQRGESGVEEVAWFVLTSTLGAWGVLVLAKLWEGTHGDPILRRFAMLIVGLGLGAASFGLDQLLMVRLPFQSSIRPASWHIDWDFYNRLDGAPHLEAYLAYFGLMFVLIPWWRQADPLRPSRVRVGSIAWTLAVALLLNLICPFPQPWGTIVATIISLSVQLASPSDVKPNRLATGGKNASSSR